MPVQTSVRLADPSVRPFISQTPPHGTNQPMHYRQASSFGNKHSEIAKIVHKVLQPLVKQYPLWNPPSRDYMSTALECQMCKVIINELDTLLVCDGCEKAYHLKCLQANNMKGVPKSDWYCSRCVQALNGKPFPPKYGRTVSTKTSSSTAGAQSSEAKKLGPMDIKVNQPKPIVTRSPGVQNFPGFVSGAATTSASAAKTSNSGPQGFRESLICGTRSTAPISLTKTPNPRAIASTSALTYNGLISKALTPMSCTSQLPVGNRVHVNATSNATPGAPISASLVAHSPTVTEYGDSSSTASGTADRSILNTDLTTQVHALTVTSGSNSQPVVSHSETAKATEDAALGQAFSADDGPQAQCETPSESTTSPSDSLNDKTASENGQESSKDAAEKLAFEACENHPTESPAAVISDQESKINQEPSMPQENLANHTEKTACQPPLVLSNHHSQSEELTPNVQD